MYITCTFESGNLDVSIGKQPIVNFSTLVYTYEAGDWDIIRTIYDNEEQSKLHEVKYLTIKLSGKTFIFKMVYKVTIKIYVLHLKSLFAACIIAHFHTLKHLFLSFNKANW